MRNRNIQIPLRLNEKEFAHLQKQVDNSCLDRAKYLRALIMGHRVHPQPCEAYIEIQRLLSSVSNNMNQIARVGNQTGFISEMDTAYIKIMAQKLWEMFKKLD